MTAPILVCGRRGQVATDLVEAAERPRPARSSRSGGPISTSPIRTSIARALDRVEPTAVINAAAYTAVDRAESEPDAAFALNRDGPARLARACAARRLPLIHLSTDQVFDGRKEGGFGEDDPPNPLCVYGASKLAGERAVAEARRRSPDRARVLGVRAVRRQLRRQGSGLGPGARHPVDRLRPARPADLLAGPRARAARPRRPHDGRRRERPADGGRPRGLLHLAGGSVLTRFEQAELILAGSAARGGPTARVEPVLTADFPVPAARPLNAELDVSRARDRYGIELGRFEADLDATLDRLLGPRAQGSRRPRPHGDRRQGSITLSSPPLAGVAGRHDLAQEFRNVSGPCFRRSIRAARVVP